MTTIPALRRRTAAIAVPVAACLAVSAMASPAAAARPDSSSTVRSGERASVSWTELDPGNLLGLPGNTHVGNLFVEDGSFGFSFGQILDLECEPGEEPGGGHEGGPGECDFALNAAGEPSIRFLDGLDLSLSVSGSTATLTGPIQVSNGGHGEPDSVLAVVQANITWTTTTDLVRYRASNTYVEGGISYRSRTTGLRSDPAKTVVTGFLGGMGFADDADDVSQGSFETYTETSRERIRTR